MISVVIPTLNSAQFLPTTLAALKDEREQELLSEVIICDGTSQDATIKCAKLYKCQIVLTAPGRGTQLQAGAKVATSSWLLFLHADTQLSPQWGLAVEKFIATHDTKCAGVFHLRFADDAWQARILEWLVKWRIKLFALPYGDQGLLIHRSLYDAIGGFHSLPLMEDVDLISRLGRKRLGLINAIAITSAARYRRAGYFARSLRNLTCLAMWFVGIDPVRIDKFYRS